MQKVHLAAHEGGAATVGVTRAEIFYYQASLYTSYLSASVLLGGFCYLMFLAGKAAWDKSNTLLTDYDDSRKYLSDHHCRTSSGSDWSDVCADGEDSGKKDNCDKLQASDTRRTADEQQYDETTKEYHRALGGDSCENECETACKGRSSVDGYRALAVFCAFPPIIAVTACLYQVEKKYQLGNALHSMHRWFQEKAISLSGVDEDKARAIAGAPKEAVGLFPNPFCCFRESVELVKPTPAAIAVIPAQATAATAGDHIAPHAAATAAPVVIV